LQGGKAPKEGVGMAYRQSVVSAIGRGLLILALAATSACATRPGAPGTTPPLDTLKLTGSPQPVAECAKTVLQKADECDSLDFGLGVTVQAAEKSARLTCYVVTPTAASVGALFGVVGVLVGAAVGTKQPADETNTTPPRYTVVLSEVEPQKIDAKFWVATALDSPDTTIRVLKAALNGCSTPAAPPTSPAVLPSTPATSPTVPPPAAAKP